MKLFSIDLTNRRGTLEVQGQANVATGKVIFQSIANGIVFFQSADYEKARQKVIDAFEINTQNAERAN
jgi:hypothetical protein